jgi:hypothetical protein
VPSSVGIAYESQMRLRMGIFTLAAERGSKVGNLTPREHQPCDHTTGMQDYVLQIVYYVLEVQHELMMIFSTFLTDDAREPD